MTSALSIMIATLIGFLSFIFNIGAQGEKAWDKQAYEKAVNSRFPLLREVADGALLPPRLEVTWDPIFEEAFGEIERANGFDVAHAANLMPDAFYYTRWQSDLFPWIYGNLSDWLLDRSMYYHEKDNTAMKTVTRIAGVMVKMPINMHFAAEPLPGEPNNYEFVAYFEYTDGSKAHAKTGTTYNTKTGRLGTDNGIGNLGFNYYVHDNLLETTNGSWQRNLGYTKLYDDIFLQSTDAADILTVRLKFRYAGKDWMLQLWKGRYINMPGAEVGLYYKPTSRLVDFYDAVTDEERIGMSFKLTDKQNGAVLIDKPLEPHWWVAGFAAYDKPLNGEHLTFETVLTPTDAAMMAALKAELDKEVAKGVLTYKNLDTKSGPAVRVVW